MLEPDVSVFLLRLGEALAQGTQHAEATYTLLGLVDLVEAAKIVVVAHLVAADEPV